MILRSLALALLGVPVLAGASAALAQESAPTVDGPATVAIEVLTDNARLERLSSVMPRAAQGERDALRIVSENFFHCTVRNNLNDAIIIVDEGLDSEALARRFPIFIDGSCAYISNPANDRRLMAFPPLTLQTEVANALVRRLYRDPGPADFSHVPTQARSERPTALLPDQLASMNDQERSQAQQRHERASSWYVMERIGECVARRYPETVRQLAQTDVVSPSERAVMGSLAPFLGACVPAGSTVRLALADVRAAAVFAYYRLARAASAAPQGTP